MRRILIIPWACVFVCLGADAVNIRVDAARVAGPWKPVTAFFGYDEPNYTYMEHGRKLVSELVALSRTPVHIRVHNLLTTGDGTPALKWGSTNAYTESASGEPVYDWRIVDQIFDTYVKAGAKPFVEIGFMPEALSTHPQPYRHEWPRDKLETGWSYPPKDYAKWRELVRACVRHSGERYGQAEVESWYWEVWNEPDIFYWQGAPQEYNRLYDFAVDGVKSVLPRARVGGPASTGPASAKAAAFLRQFLEHCARGKNEATGRTGAPLDYISYHAKGSPKAVGGRVRMGLARNLQDVAHGLDVIADFPKFRDLPVILSECDPEGCAACSARVYPQNAYRNGELYAAYTAEVLGRMLEIADRRKANIEGMLTWAFEFEGQPYFDGFRTLATNGIDKPVLNLFRMVGLMSGNRVAVESSGAAELDDVLAKGVASNADVNGIATASEREISVLVWNYHDEPVDAAPAPVRVSLAGVPGRVRRVAVREYRIDRDHSNAYTVWKAMGLPQQLSPEQYARLEAAGQLQMLGSPRFVNVNSGVVQIETELPRESVSLIQLNW